MNELARFTTLEDLVVALKARRQSLGLSQFMTDEIAGMARDHTFKIERGIKGLGKITIPLLLGALKCELVLVPSAASHPESYGATSRYAHSPKKERVGHHAMIGAKGGRARAANMPSGKRRAAAQRAAKARWARRVSEATLTGGSRP